MNKMFQRLCNGLLLTYIIMSSALAPTRVEARIWNITPDSTGDALTIQAAIDSAQAGDVVQLAPGLYTRSAQGDSIGIPVGDPMIVLKTGVDILGVAGPEQTVVDGEQKGSVFVGRDVGQLRIEGLTIMRGGDSQGGGLLFLGASEPTIANCILRDNVAFFGAGGAIKCDVATILGCEFFDNKAVDGAGGAIACTEATIRECVFSNNVSFSDPGGRGGAIAIRGAIVEDCRFKNNRVTGPFSATGAAVRVSGLPSGPSGGTFRRCVFVNNAATVQISGTPAGGGIYCLFGDVLISECVFIGNSATTPSRPGLGAAVYVNDTAGNVTIENCTILGNRSVEKSQAPDGVAGILFEAGGLVSNTIIAYNIGRPCGGTGTYRCVNIFGNAISNDTCGVDGGGNFSLDPQFCAVDPIATENVDLQSDSPCAALNQPVCGRVGASATTCGAVSIERTTWGIVKELFRR